jgi:hypothetical protein
MKSYYRVMLGKGSKHATECVAGNFIGADYQINQNLLGKLPDDWRAFNKEFIPVFMATHPDKTKIGAGLVCGALWAELVREKSGIKVHEDYMKKYLSYSMVEWAPQVANLIEVLKQILSEFRAEDTAARLN